MNSWIFWRKWLARTQTTPTSASSGSTPTTSPWYDQDHYRVWKLHSKLNVVRDCSHSTKCTPKMFGAPRGGALILANQIMFYDSICICIANECYVCLPAVLRLTSCPFQLVPYWEKTFGIDLGSPQIGVVDVEDVRSYAVHAWCKNTLK